jgi:hypothetical protein
LKKLTWKTKKMNDTMKLHSVLDLEGKKKKGGVEMKKRWVTLASSASGTQKIEIQKKLTYEEAIVEGLKMCMNYGHTYLGTYLPNEVENSEANYYAALKAKTRYLPC